MKKISHGNVSTKARDRTTLFLFILFGAFSLFTFYGGDVIKYREMIESIPYLERDYYGFTMEYIYIYISLLVKGDFYLWKIIVYGLALIITFLTIKKLHLDNFATLLFFIGFNLYSYGATRAVLGYSLYVYGLAFLFDRNLRGYIIGILLIASSYFAHSSMLLIILLTPLCYIKMGKKKVFVSLAAFPIVVTAFNIITNNLLGGDLSVFGDYLSYKIDRYTDDEGGAGTNYGALSLLIQSLVRLAILIPFIAVAVKQSLKGRLDRRLNKFVSLSYVIAYISFLFYFSSIHNGLYLFNRYIAICPFILFLVAGPIFNVGRKQLTSLKVYSYALLLLGNYTFAYLVYIAYANHTIIIL